MGESAAGACGSAAAAGVHGSELACGPADAAAVAWRGSVVGHAAVLGTRRGVRGLVRGAVAWGGSPRACGLLRGVRVQPGGARGELAVSGVRGVSAVGGPAALITPKLSRSPAQQG